MPNNDFLIEFHSFAKGVTVWSLVFLIIGCMLLFVNLSNFSTTQIVIVGAINFILLVCFLVFLKKFLKARKELKPLLDKNKSEQKNI